MGFFGLFNALSPTRDSKDMVARYKRLRPTRLRLNNELVQRLSRDMLDEGAKKIGILRNGIFVFENEDETSVLMDYCIYNVFRKGRNAVKQFLCDCPPDPDSDEMACLRAMEYARYSLVAVVRVEPGVGCHVLDLFTEETRLLVDLGLSKTAQPGTVMATRLLDFGGFIATGGAALPVGILDEEELDRFQQTVRAAVDADCSDPAPLIRDCLQNGASSHVRYEGTDIQRRSAIEGSPARIDAPAQRRLAHAKRNATNARANRRCPYGSGKMFMNCCGKH